MSFFDPQGQRALGQGFLCPIGSVTDPDLASHVVAYKRAVASRYRALTPDELDQLPPGPLHVSPKIDGELWMLVLDPELDQVALVSPKQRVIHGDVPVLSEARRNLLPRCSGRTILAGELFALRKDGRPRVGDVGQALSGGESAQVARLGYHAFDLMKASDEVPAEYKERLPVLQALCEGGKRLQAVKTELVSGTEAVQGLWDTWAEGGKAEGLVVRAGDHRVFKVKPAFHLDAVVIGFTERVGDDGRDLCRSILMALMREDGQLQILGSCGNFGGDDERARFHQLLAPSAVPSSYRYPSSSGALYRFVKPQHVVEIKVSDLQTEDSGGKPIQRYVLDFEDEAGWTPIRPMSGVSILHPVFVRRREDKTVDGTDIRVGQVLERVEVPDLDARAEAVALPPSTVLRREVWTKTTKGLISVRKLLLWRTNKDRQDPLYPPFVVHWTDYSPGRKDPLKREVKLAPTLEEANRLADAMVVKGVKRGWDPA
jgi:ATP-dependent DNA ligase